MAFTTQIFTFAFLPVSVILYFLGIAAEKKWEFFRKARTTDLMLIVISFGFYMWACFDDGITLLLYILFVYAMGRLIQGCADRDMGFVLVQKDHSAGKTLPVSMIVSALAIGVTVCILVHFNYLDLFCQTWNFVMNDNAQVHAVTTILGISFITFSAVSYLADIAGGKAKAGDLIDCALYLSFFPKVVSGPIILWRDFAGQSRDKQICLESVSDGVSRIMIGYGKKLILADTFGLCISNAAGVPIDVPTAWGLSLLYMLQIYYDFSGYSDIAIGLSRVLGFRFKENFHFPYLSTSITEFWRRWHISLGTWFREYIYFPLGGSRVSRRRTIVNIGIVFLLTGIWHGAGWTYLIWGAINGLCNIIEKCISSQPAYQKTPKVLKWLMTMCVTFFAWQIFRLESFPEVTQWFRTMFGLAGTDGIPYTWQYYFDRQIVTFAVVGILGATVLGFPGVQRAYQRALSTRAGYLLNQAVLCMVFVLAILFMVNSTYSPFIYFQY